MAHFLLQVEVVVKVALAVGAAVYTWRHVLWHTHGQLQLEERHPFWRVRIPLLRQQLLASGHSSRCVPCSQGLASGCHALANARAVGATPGWRLQELLLNRVKVLMQTLAALR